MTVIVCECYDLKLYGEMMRPSLQLQAKVLNRGCSFVAIVDIAQLREQTLML